MIHEREDGAKTRFSNGLEQTLNFGAREHDGQHFRFSDADFPEDGPILDLDALEIKAEQRILGGLHGRGLVMLVLAEEQKILAQLVLCQGRRITLKMFSQFADVTDVFLFGGGPIIFKLDELLEPGDRRVVDFHPGRLPGK